MRAYPQPFLPTVLAKVCPKVVINRPKLPLSLTWDELMSNGGLIRLIYRNHFSIDPTKGRVELSLKGTDTGGPDPAPKPKRMEEKERKDKEKKERRKKRKMEKESSDQSDDEAEEILKRLKTGKQVFSSCICSRLKIATFTYFYS